MKVQRGKMKDSVLLRAGDTGKFPKREKKKAETRQKIIDASLELYFERDPRDVTLEHVAERAGIHVQTLYRHFPNKTSLMTAGDDYWLEKFEAYLEDNKDIGDTFAVWRSWLTFAYTQLLEDADKFRNLNRRKFQDVQALAALWGTQVRYEDLLCEGLAKDFRISAKGMGLPRLVAGMLVAGNAAVMRTFTEEGGDLLTECIKVIDTVEKMFASHIKSAK